ncbi:uncharacterized protein METZ01_LOCUS127360 [marine metagenome]|jgi:hypothetical protein|uniref:Uncharacterized protein n=1 Tax=marine metagenome TaxID=408172 RepID=A0A381YBQ1_9ZZZZ|tara:strand:+ start:1073 stop:1345 length:273 start_codon:yes stop_codon:yes gene_type:complete
MGSKSLWTGLLQADRNGYFATMAFEKISKLIRDPFGEAVKRYGDLYFARLFVGLLFEKSPQRLDIACDHTRRVSISLGPTTDKNDFVFVQ